MLAVRIWSSSRDSGWGRAGVFVRVLWCAVCGFSRPTTPDAKSGAVVSGRGKKRLFDLHRKMYVHVLCSCAVSVCCVSYVVR